MVAAPSRSPLLFASWIWRIIQWAVCLALYTHSAVAAQPLYESPLLFACDAGAWTWRGCHIQAEFCSRPLTKPRSPLHSCSSDVAPPDLVYMTSHRSAPYPRPRRPFVTCEVNGDAAPRPRTSGNRQTDGRHASNHVYRYIIYTYSTPSQQMYR